MLPWYIVCHRCVGLAFQHFVASRKEFAPVVLPKISQNAYMQQFNSDKLDISGTGTDKVVLVMQNLLIDRNNAEVGLERRLIEHCEIQAKV